MRALATALIGLLLGACATRVASGRRGRAAGHLSMLRAASTFLHGRNAFYVSLLLLPPLLWLRTVYLGSLFALLAQSFYAIDEFTARVVPELTLATYRQLVAHPANVDIILRTLLMAVAVTIACGIVAFPVAHYMARHAGPKMKAFFYVGVMLPMWTSYLVKVYAWRLILAKQGIVAWGFDTVGATPLLDRVLTNPVVGGPSLASSYFGMFIVFVYMWLPFMILPLAAALERVPESLLQASADLGASPRQTFRHVVLPLALALINVFLVLHACLQGNNFRSQRRRTDRIEVLGFALGLEVDIAVIAGSIKHPEQLDPLNGIAVGKRRVMVHPVLEAVQMDMAQMTTAQRDDPGGAPGKGHRVGPIRGPDMTDIQDQAHLRMVHLIQKGQAVLNPLPFFLEIFNQNDDVRPLDVANQIRVAFEQRGVGFRRMGAPHVSAQLEHRVDLPPAMVHARAPFFLGLQVGEIRHVGMVRDDLDAVRAEGLPDVPHRSAFRHVELLGAFKELDFLDPMPRQLLHGLFSDRPWIEPTVNWGLGQTLSAQESAILGSLEQVDDYPLYTMHYSGPYTLSSLTDEITGEPTMAVTTPPLVCGSMWGCSLFASLGDQENRIFGRNFDWRFSPALLLFNNPPDGYASVSMVDIAYLGFAGERSGHLTELPLEELRPLLDATYRPFDGMNEKGLAIGMAAVPGQQMPDDPNLKTIGQLELIREILDHAGTVEEAIKILNTYNIDMVSVPIHYLIASASGDSAVVEFYQGKMVVFRNDSPWHVATNFLLAGTQGDTKGHCWRFDRINRRLQKLEGRISAGDAMQLLNEVSQENTQWSILYHMTSGELEIVMGRDYSEPSHTFHLGGSTP